MMHHVYEMYAENWLALYVGCTKDLGTRLKQHVSRAWWPDITRIEVNSYPDRDAALRAEKELIRRLNPVHNSQFTDHPGNSRAAQNARAEERHARGEQCTRGANCERCDRLAGRLVTTEEIQRRLLVDEILDLIETA